MIKTFFAPAEKATDSELENAVKKVREHYVNQPHVQNLLNAIPNILLIFNQERQIVFCSPTFSNLLGVDPKDLLGQRIGEALHCINSTLNLEGGCGTSPSCQYCGAVNSILSGLKGDSNSGECNLIKTDGDAINLAIKTVPLLLDQRQYVLCHFQDISAKKNRDNLERIFFHDILNTAGLVQSFSEALGDEEIDSSASNLVKIIQKNSSAMIEEIRSQQILLKAEAGELTLELQKLESRILITKLVESFSENTLAKNKSIIIDSDTCDITFSSDPGLLGRVLRNMLKNALEASAAGDVITVGCRLKEKQLEFWAQNPSVMPADVQSQLFSRYYSTKGKGRGLGTYSMKLLTERYLKGKLSFISSADKGTIFCASYPIGH